MALTDGPPLTDEEIYGEAKPRTYLEAITAEQRLVLQRNGQLPVEDQGADAAAAPVNAPVEITPDPEAEPAPPVAKAEDSSEPIVETPAAPDEPAAPAAA